MTVRVIGSGYTKLEDLEHFETITIGDETYKKIEDLKNYHMAFYGCSTRPMIKKHNLKRGKDYIQQRYSKQSESWYLVEEEKYPRYEDRFLINIKWLSNYEKICGPEVDLDDYFKFWNDLEDKPIELDLIQEGISPEKEDSPIKLDLIEEKEEIVNETEIKDYIIRALRNEIIIMKKDNEIALLQKEIKKLKRIIKSNNLSIND